MKKLLLGLFLLTGLFASCDSSEDIEEIPVDIVLSANGSIWMDNLDCEFDILEGNGEYIATVSEQPDGDMDAKVTVEGTKVKVSMLTNNAVITITDRKQKEASVNIYSSAKELYPSNYTLTLSNGKTHEMHSINFGVGQYTLKKVKGNSTDVSVDENDVVKVKALSSGTSYYKLVDRRGVTANLKIMVTAEYDLEGNSIEVNTHNDELLFITLKSGGEWQFENSNPGSSLLKSIHLHSKGDIEKKYDIVQIDTNDEGVKGRTIINLKDKDGNIASIILNVE